MKVRLSIGNGSGEREVFEHPGPLVRMGRDESCELTLESAGGSAISRQHAQLVLSAKGATVADMGSSNGTLLNGELIDRAAPLHVGDRIQLGYTGPSLTVLELDLTPVAAPQPPGSRHTILYGSIAAGVALVLLAIALIIVLRKPDTPDIRTQNLPPDQVIDQRAAEPNKSETSSNTPGRPDNLLTPGPSPAPQTKEGAVSEPSEDVKPVGSYIVLERWISVLLQRQGEAYPWLVLRPETRITTGYTLVSLPGYRSLIGLDSGLRLTLWGDLPEFSRFPPVLESVVMLNPPAAGTDLDFTLDRGRVVIANQKTTPGPARVRLRFLNQSWDLELRDPRAEVALELWTPPGGPPSDSKEQGLPTYLGVFSKGRVRVQTPSQVLNMADRSRISWTNMAATVPLQPVQLQELPAWWAKPLDRKQPKVEKAMLSLLDWSAKLGGSNADRGNKGTTAAGDSSVVATIKTLIDEKPDPDDKDLGVSFLAALEEIKLLVVCLNDRQNPDVRGTALFALQSWLGRGRQHAAMLANILEDNGYSRDKADRIIALMHVYSPQALDQKQTYEDLIANLDDDNLLVRDVAFWQLDRLWVGGRLPPEAKGISYDPTWGEAKQRQPAIAQWKKLLAQGKLPYRSLK